MNSVRLALLVVVCLAVSGPVRSDEPDKTTVVRLAITPAVEPVPALKYQLLPEFKHRRPGNAALDYGRAIAFSAEGRRSNAKSEEEWSQWLDLPRAEFEQKIKGRDLSSLRESEALKLVRLGALCERCDWQLPLRDQPYFSVVLPELSELRAFARLLALNIRLNIVEGNYEAAIGRLQTGYAMARHAAQEPTLVSGLVGVSIAAVMDKARLDMVEGYGAPSLYWAETFLPQPLIDLRPGLEAEMYGLQMSFPALNGTPRTAEGWNTEFLNLLNELPPLLAMANDTAAVDEAWKKPLAAVVFLARTAARRDELRTFLVTCGQSKEDTEEMTDPQLLLEFTRLKFEVLRDDMIRLLPLPYPQAKPYLVAAENRLKESIVKRDEIIPAASLLLPALLQIRHSHARADRRRDVLQLIEALRLHVAKHDGALPKSLADVTMVPMPLLDPVTGKPFDYVLDGAMARLTLPEERTGDKTTLVYEITVASGK